MKRNANRVLVFVSAGVLLAISNSPVMAQARGGGGKGAAGTGGGTKATGGQIRSAGPQFTTSNPSFSSGIANNAFNNNAFRPPAFNANTNLTRPTNINKGPANRPNVIGNGVNYGGGGVYGVRIPRGNSYYFGGFDLGYGLRDGFDPYILQGYSNWSPQVFSTVAPAYSPNIFAEPMQNNNYVNPAAIGNATNKGIQVETAPAPRTTTASVAVLVPNENAELWFNGVKTQTAGQRREFVTPELNPGEKYTYEVRVRWTQDGKIYEQTRAVSVQAGAQAVLNFLDLREQLPPPIGIKI